MWNICKRLLLKMCSRNTKKKKKKKKKKITIPTFPKKGTSANGRFRRCVQEIQKTK